MSQNGKYTLLLMRDDTGVKRMRISSGWVKFFVIFILLIVILGGASIWLGSKLWLENRNLKLQVAALDQQSTLMQVRLDRLSPLEYILQTADPSEMSDILSRIGSQPGSGTLVADGQGAGQAADSATNASGASGADAPQGAGDSAGTSGEGAAAPDAAGGTSTASGDDGSAGAGSQTLPGNGGISEPGSGGFTLAPTGQDLPPRVDDGKVALDNVFARLVSSDTRMELAYDMVNLDSGSRAEGRLHLSVVMEDNSVHRLTISASQSLFSMNARKIVSRYNIALPEEARSGKVVALMAEMLLGQTISYRQFYTLPATP